MTEISTILNKLEKVKPLSNGEYQACCPAHDDKKPSLNLKQADGKILVNCQAGCRTEDVLKKLDLQMSDLFINGNNVTKEIPSKIVATYDYKDEQGNLLYQVVRYTPKGFSQRHKNDKGEWTWNLEGVRRVLYRLPDILESLPGDTVYVCEGEKDIDALWGWGIPATTSPGGSNNWKPEYAQYLKGLKVVIIPDKDTAGFAYAREVAQSLNGKAQEVKVIILPGDNVKDFSDWLGVGGEVEQLPDLQQDVSVLFEQDKPKYQVQGEAIYWVKPVKDHSVSFKAERISNERTGIHARITISADHQMLAWSYFNIERSDERVRLANNAHQQIKSDLAKELSKEELRRCLDLFCAGLWEASVAIFLPEFMSGDETQVPLKFLLYPYILDEGATILFAPPGRGKSYTALLWAQSVNCGISKYWQVTKSPVLFINLERSKQSLRRRLAAVNKALGLPPQTELLTLNARGKSLSSVMPACRQAIAQHHVKLIVLDSISRAGFGDLTENRPVNAIVDALSSLCESWLALGHTPRANEDHVYGSVMMDAGADITIQLNSETKDDGTLGVGWNITKKNDLPTIPQEVKAFEFDQFGLYIVRDALDYEFPEIEGKTKVPMLQAVIDCISDQDSGDATATQISNITGFNRANISSLLTKSGKFFETRRVKTSVYYGVKAVENE